MCWEADQPDISRKDRILGVGLGCAGAVVIVFVAAVAALILKQVGV